MRFTRGQGLAITVNGTKYYVAPGWGAHIGNGLMLPGDTENVKIAAGYLLHLIHNGGRP